MRVAQQSTPVLVLVEGEAGIGKTLLVQKAVAEGGLRATWARSDPTERAHDLGVVRQLLGAAAGHPGPPVRDVFSAGGALLALMDRLQAEGEAAALVIEDAHWADEPSLQALLFAFRRLHVDPVLMLLTSRPSWAGPAADTVRSLVSSGVAHRTSLGGLDLATVRQLAQHFGHEGLGPTAVRGLMDHTGGHPLHLCELFRTLPTAALATTASLPAPPSLASVVRRRVTAASAAARELVAAVAVLGGSPPLLQAAAVAGLSDPHAALDEGLERGLLSRPWGADAAVVSAHPLVAAAVRDGLPHDALIGLHRRAAAVVQDSSAQLRHRVAAADGGDPDLVRDLVERGERQAAAAAWAAAALDVARAAELELEPDRRRVLWLRAAEHSLSAADAPQAVRWLAETGDDDSPMATYLRGRLALIRGDVEDAQVLLTTAYRAATASHDQGTAARSAQQLAWLALDRGQAADVIQWASVATDDDDPALARAGRGLLALGQTIAGHGPQALAALPPLPRQLSVHHLELATVRGTLRLYTDDLVGARSDLRSALRVMGTDSYHLAFPVHANLAEVEQRAGNWDAAVLHGQLAVSAIDDVEQLWLRAPTLALAVTAPARRGQWDDATRLSQAATCAAQEMGDVLGSTYAATAAARLSDSRGDWAGVVAVTEVLVELLAREVDGPGEPGIVDWQELRAEALVRLGRLHLADALLMAMDEAARAREHRSGAAAVARVRGLLETARTRRAAAERSFCSAAQAFMDLGYTFARARTLLDWGTAAREWGQAAAAARLLGEAAAEFSRLEARPFLARLPAVPGAAVDPPDAPQLRPQELAIALLIAQGRTNREIAQELMLSVKTVEFHLSQVFRRHQLRSRSQLAALVSRSSRPGSPHPP